MCTVVRIAYRWFLDHSSSLVGSFNIGICHSLCWGWKLYKFLYLVAKRFGAFCPLWLGVTGHQLANSYYAMLNGGWFGLGLEIPLRNVVICRSPYGFCLFGVIGSLVRRSQYDLALLFFLILRIILVGIRARVLLMVAIGAGRADPLFRSLSQYRWDFRGWFLYCEVTSARCKVGTWSIGIIVAIALYWTLMQVKNIAKLIRRLREMSRWNL